MWSVSNYICIYSGGTKTHTHIYLGIIYALPSVDVWFEWSRELLQYAQRFLEFHVRI